MPEKSLSYILQEYQDITAIINQRTKAGMMESKKFTIAGGGIGVLGGIFLAHKKQSGVLGYLGWIIAFNVLGGIAGGIVDSFLYDSNKAIKGVVDKSLALRMGAYIKDAEPFMSNETVKRNVSDIKNAMSLAGY